MCDILLIGLSVFELYLCYWRLILDKVERQAIPEFAAFLFARIVV
nr:MAG TPA: hypothetical protein [Caudoviricetes sp.]